MMYNSCIQPYISGLIFFVFLIQNFELQNFFAHKKEVPQYKKKKEEEPTFDIFYEHL